MRVTCFLNSLFFNILSRKKSLTLYGLSHIDFKKRYLNFNSTIIR